MELTHLALPWVIAIFGAGLILLFAGGHYLVDGSSKLAQMLGVNRLIVGLTIVALGTSMPEFLVSMLAAVQDKTDVALGNIIGSNVSNIGLILGVSALARPIAINLKLLKFEVPLLIAISLFFWLICFNSVLSRFDGFALLTGFAAYLYIVIAGARKDSREQVRAHPPAEGDGRKKLWFLATIIVGITALSIGADWIVESASEISLRLKVPQLVLGLTVVALGTSLPELATSLVAALRREGDISIGNIIGSNIFNLMAIAGPSALVRPMPVSEELRINHLPIMVGLTLLMFPLLRTGRKLGRLEGALLVGCYLSIMFWWTR